MDWLELRRKVGHTTYHDSDHLKAELAIPFVLEQAGHPVSASGGKYVTRCPFHEDRNPSFDVFGEHLERWGCWPCGIGGDVLDLVERLWRIERFVHVKDKAAELLNLQISSGWSGPTTGAAKQPFDRDVARELIMSSQMEAATDWMAVFSDLVGARPRLADADPEDLRAAFRLGSYRGAVVVPYYAQDLTLVAYKQRRPGEKIMAAPGTEFTDILYGEWLDDGTKPVLLCEGESDVWAAWNAVGDRYAVLGLPTGVGRPPVQANRLAGREVVLAFDGDEAARQSLVRWYEALKTQDCTVRIATMPDDLDLASVADIAEIVDSSLSIPSPVTLIDLRAEGIWRIPRTDKQEPVQLSNFSLLPTRQLVGTEEVDAWECSVLPADEPVVLSTVDMASKNRLIAWSGRHGGSWFGTDTDAQYLQAWLQSVRPFLAQGRTTTVAGLHDEQFVWPGGSIGKDHWVYSPGANDVELHRYIQHLHGGEFHFWEQFAMLRALHSPEVMDPILAWLAIAPLRSLVAPFPTLAVMGSSGTGKTTLLETVLHHFTGTTISVNLTSTSRFAISSFASATNAFPVWFDEYRPGAASDAILALDQIVRDSYNGHGSAKGGMGDHWAQVKLSKAEAPLIVSGEDAFQETSHVERIVPVYLTTKGRNSDILQQVQQWPGHGWAMMWLRALQWGLQTGDIPSLSVQPVEVPGLAPRMQTNLGVLRRGWDLLEHFGQRMGAPDFPEPNFDGVIRAWTADAKTDPIREAILWALDEPDASEYVTLADDRIHIRIVNFVEECGRRFKLPGGSKAIKRHLIDQLDAQPDRAYFHGTRARTYSISSATILSEED